MKRYKLNKDQKGFIPSNEEIMESKNFSQLHHQYEKLTKRPGKPLYKNPIAFIVLVLIILILLMIMGEV